MNDQLNSEERDILEKFERGELRSAREAEREMETARRATRSTFNKTRRVNLRVTERDFNLAHARALEEGIPIRRSCRASSTNTCQVGWSRRDRTDILGSEEKTEGMLVEVLAAGGPPDASGTR